MNKPAPQRPRSVPHNWKPGDTGWYLTTAISQPPIMVSIARDRLLSPAAVPIDPVWFGERQTLSDGSNPDGLPEIASPSDLFQHYDAAWREQRARCRSAIFEMLQAGAAEGEP